MSSTALVVSRRLVLHALAALVALFAPAVLLAQATSDANQIVGDVELLASDPGVVAVLTAEGISSGTVSATSVGVTPTLNHSTSVTVAAPALATYELTVEAGPVGDGIVYDLAATLLLDGGRDVYRFEGVTSAGVEREPEPDVRADFGECAAILDVRWETPSGTPVSVSGGRVNALLHTVTGGRFLQAWTPSLGAVAGERLAVRGGNSFDVEIFFDVGSDPFVDQVRLLHEVEVTAACDEVIEIVCEVPEAGGGGEGEGLGRIVGEVDMLGSFEERVADLTIVRALNGPLGNLRLDTVEPLVPGGPSSGDFELINMPPSDLASPPLGYRVFTEMTFATPGGHHQWFRSPNLSDGNGRVLVSNGQTVDLGDTFVMDPGLLVGDLQLVGPAAPAGDNCLADLRILNSGGADGIPDGSQFRGSGVSTPAAGATFDTFRGSIQSALLGAYDTVGDEFLGGYEAVAGALDGEAGIWRANQVLYNFSGSTVPEGIQSSSVFVFDLVTPEVTVAPGDLIRNDRRLCFGEVHVGFRSLGGNLFRLPRLTGNGELDGTDSFGDTVDQAYNVPFSSGTPQSVADASTRGLVNLCLPEGAYTFTPTVRSIDPDGTESNTELPPIDVEVACGQVLDLIPGLQVSLDAPPACVAEPTVRLTGSVSSDGDPVDRVFGTANGDSETTFCTTCGADPAFDFDQPLDACDNQVTVGAEAFGETAAATATTRFDGTPPELLGCEDVVAESEAAVVEYAVTAGDACDGALPVVCDPPSGSLFGPGETVVTCQAVDTCGNPGSCTFTVSTCTPVEPDVRTQGFWKRQCAGPHPSGEHERLPEYVGDFTATDTFAAVSDAGAMCDRLSPQPKQDKCEQAEAQYAALLLNVASDRIRSCNCLDDPDLGFTQLGDALAAIDELLSDPARSHGDCVLAQAVADRVNRGASPTDCKG